MLWTGTFDYIQQYFSRVSIALLRLGCISNPNRVAWSIYIFPTATGLIAYLFNREVIQISYIYIYHNEIKHVFPCTAGRPKFAHIPRLLYFLLFGFTYYIHYCISGTAHAQLQLCNLWSNLYRMAHRITHIQRKQCHLNCKIKLNNMFSYFVRYAMPLHAVI